jgi:hypothetical protein
MNPKGQCKNFRHIDGEHMTIEEAKKILLENRPDRPKSTERRQLQVAIDIILKELEVENNEGT